MIATLVVQLLSMHEGGDLVVYQGNMEHRYDYGKADGTAAFANHSAVHYADAVHTLEEVKNGYRVVLVYSVCLPPEMRHLERKQDGSDVETMTEAMKHVKELFTLFFRHECTDKSITEHGSDTLKASTIQWLKDQDGISTQPFTWEMPLARSEDDALEQFLRDPEKKTRIAQFRSIGGTRGYVSACEWSQANASFTMTAGGHASNSYADVVKTKKHFEDREKALRVHKREANLLIKQYAAVPAAAVTRKCLREDGKDAVVLE
ncbi:hypothetical protein FI667_g5597, partial [Globisporangium splendens]